MSCSEKGGNSAVTSWARDVAPGRREERARNVSETFHRLIREGKDENVEPPTKEQVAEFLDEQEYRVRNSNASEGRKRTVLAHIEHARETEQVPTGAVWHAWQNLEGEVARGNIRPAGDGSGGVRKSTREQAEQLKAIRRDLLRDPDRLSAFLESRSKFRRYSMNNQMLILAQKPDATQVAAASTWEQLGRKVKKEELNNGIGIYAYSTTRWKEKDEDTGEEKEYSRTRFPVVRVFDISQTEGDPLPESIPTLTENPPKAMEDGLRDTAARHGIKVEERPLTAGVNKGTLYGAFARTARGDDHPGGTLYLNSNTSPGDRAYTAGHELAHALDPGLNGPGMSDADSHAEYVKNRPDAEVVAETSAWMYARHHGYNTDRQAAEYVISWCKDDPKKLDRVLSRVDKVMAQLIPESAEDKTIRSATEQARDKAAAAAKPRKAVA